MKFSRPLVLVSMATLGLHGVAHAQSVTRTVTYSYDAYGALIQEVDEPTGDVNSVKVTTNYIRDNTAGGYTGVLTTTQVVFHDPASNTDITRSVQTLGYDAKYRYPTTETNAKSQSETRSYDDGTGNLLSRTGPNMLTTSWLYDGWGRKIRDTRADGTYTTTAYRGCIDSCIDSAAIVTVTQDWYASSQTTVPDESFVDVLGRTVLSRTWGFDGTAILSERVFNAQGRLDHSSRAHFAGGSVIWSYLGYDAIGRVGLVQTPNAAGSGYDSSTITYSGLATTHQNPKGQLRTEIRNGLGKLKSVTDDGRFTTGYRYDPFGNLTRTADPKGNQISVAYDNLGRKTALTDPDLGNWTYSVDPLGQTWKQIDAKTQTTTYTFDELGRMTHRVEPDLESFWAYDTATKGIGKLAEAYTWVAGAKDYRRILAYDSVGRPASTTTSLDWDYVEEYAYDGFQRPNATNYRRNARGGSGGPLNTVTRVYNAQGYVSQLTRYDGTNTATVKTISSVDAELRTAIEQFGSGLETERHYNAYTGRLETITTGADSSGHPLATIQSDSYAYDSIGNLTSRSQYSATSGPSVVESFGYDNLNRLASSQVSGQSSKADSYDANGNLTVKDGQTYAYPAQGAGSVRPHALSSITGTLAGVTNPSFTYDANGNLSTGLTRSYGWTSYNQATTIDKTSGGTAVQRTALAFATEHQRTKQTVSPMSGGIPGAATDTIYYAGSIEKEINATANTTTIRTYVPGAGYIEEVFSGTSIPSSSSGTRNPRYFHTDHLGSLLVITDQSQAVLQRMSYDPWGRRRNNNGTDDTSASLGSIANGQDHSGYTGEEQLDQLALVHLNGRVYDPITGRMTSADPTVPDASDPQSLNRFSYALNNSLAFVDPSGYFPLGLDVQTMADPFSTGSGFLLAFGCNGGTPCPTDPPPPPPPDQAAGSPERSQPIPAGDPGNPYMLPLQTITSKREVQEPTTPNTASTGFAQRAANSGPVLVAAGMFVALPATPPLVKALVIAVAGYIIFQPYIRQESALDAGHFDQGNDSTSALNAKENDANSYIKPPKDAYDKFGAKAPGKPGKAEDFQDPKSGENWVKNPNGRGNGWEDQNGDVWVPTGPFDQSKGDSHGGSHWDVQTPGGGHVNVYPGGARRP